MARSLHRHMYIRFLSSLLRIALITALPCYVLTTPPRHLNHSLGPLHSPNTTQSNGKTLPPFSGRIVSADRLMQLAIPMEKSLIKKKDIFKGTVNSASATSREIDKSPNDTSGPMSGKPVAKVSFGPSREVNGKEEKGVLQTVRKRSIGQTNEWEEPRDTIRRYGGLTHARDEKQHVTRNVIRWPVTTSVRRRLIDVFNMMNEPHVVTRRLFRFPNGRKETSDVEQHLDAKKRNMCRSVCTLCDRVGSAGSSAMCHEGCASEPASSQSFEYCLGLWHHHS